MKYSTLFTLLLLFTFSASAQYKKDVDAIKSMCGCYEITFNFAETFATDKDYEFRENYRSGGLEWVFPVEEEKGKIALQHLLVVADTMVIKHWRQDWLYENQELFTYDKDNRWVYTEHPKSEVKGQWTQKVYQVDDSPRYEGSASWVHVDGRHFWESRADAPLPRREFSKRDDYNVMVRRNRHEITDFGWVHEQDNDKVVRASDDKLIAREKGWNTYTKVDDQKCLAAQNWWGSHKDYWADVRFVWNEVFAKKETLEFHRKIENKSLWMSLFRLEKQLLASQYDSGQTRIEVRKVINTFLVGEESMVASR